MLASAALLLLHFPFRAQESSYDNGAEKYEICQETKKLATPFCVSDAFLGLKGI